MIDVTGSVITLTRLTPGINAIVSDRVGNDDKGANFAVPFVLVREQTTTRAVGAGRQANGRISKQSARS